MLRSLTIWFLSLALLAAGYDGLRTDDATSTQPTSWEDGTPIPPAK